MHSSEDGLFPHLGYREQSCNGVWGARSLFRFLCINTQDWDCRVIPVALFFASYAASILVSGVAAALCIPTRSVGGSPSLHRSSRVWSALPFWAQPFWQVPGDMSWQLQVHFSPDSLSKLTGVDGGACWLHLGVVIHTQWGNTLNLQ